MWVEKESAGTHVVPHNTMFRVLGWNPLEAARLGRGNAAHFRACGKSVYSTNECIEVVLILSDTPGTVQVAIAWLEALQLGVNDGKLPAQKMRLFLLREGLVYGRSDLGANFGNGELFGQHMCDVLETQ
jgi:hypothetical protein